MGSRGSGDASQHGRFDRERVAILPDEADSWPVLRRSGVSGSARWVPVHEPHQLLVSIPEALPTSAFLCKI